MWRGWEVELNFAPHGRRLRCDTHGANFFSEDQKELIRHQGCAEFRNLEPAPEFHCRSAANCAKGRRISAVGRPGQNSLKTLITTSFPGTTRRFFKAKKHFSAVDSGTAGHGCGAARSDRRALWIATNFIH
jgi:hypothetical protein